MGYRVNDETAIRPGDRITAYGYTFTVSKILFQEYWGPREAVPEGSDCWGYDIEFTDPEGRYHHWKQNQDNGKLIRASA